jgi:hypothetical protein
MPIQNTSSDSWSLTIHINCPRGHHVAVSRTPAIWKRWRDLSHAGSYECDQCGRAWTLTADHLSQAFRFLPTEPDT